MKKISADRIVSVSAIIVSIFTLLMIFYQTSLTRRHQRASVMPSLEIGYSTKKKNDRLNESIWVSNKGLGPAFLEKISIIEDGQTLNMDPYEFLSKTPARTEVTYFDKLYPGRIIPANEGITTFEKVTDSTSQIIIGNIFKFSFKTGQTTNDGSERALIEIIYKSVYGEKWKIRSDQSTPAKID
ncbi:hypothetical protein [Poritiphilus flavus]|uniref:Uncharacterized protein n=1 Tax=Poritiphilus flavus TaxID=2697053 RepID=A0A6L9EBM5_9FLAO|nr:hypothetical protein [Poritiphilus flavus]NAS11958.1 hypothetical protein [Poritiphilus flavus]